MTEKTYKFEGAILVEVVSATGLHSSHTSVIGSILAKDNESWKSIREFKTTTATGEPIWGEDFDAQVIGTDDLKVIFHVNDQKRKNAVFLGEVSVDVGAGFKQFGEPIEANITDSGKVVGQLTFEVNFFPGAHAAERKNYSTLKKEIATLRRELATLKK
eukprot:TRINITY_DN264_c0_g1_i1.p2 TRINITY_DN264_c0_g1~~TRINITY_DN264_c0_g1_i1.p2  ORF type:complete len:159 (-),score=19.20 TRINITY_DN264_c0_g1_i1:46-522(-)